MSEHQHEPTADERETARLDDLAAQNEAVRRAEHPEEFTDDGADERDGADEEPATLAPVAPAGTGAEDGIDESSRAASTSAERGPGSTPSTSSDTPPANEEELARLAELEAAASSTSSGGAVKDALVYAAQELRHRLFGQNEGTGGS